MAGGIVGTISCWGYGYSVKMLINGKDIGLAGGGSEGKRVFSTDHPLYAEAPPEMREKLFVLKEGANEVSVSFSRKSSNPTDYLQIVLEAGSGVPDYLFYSRARPSGEEKSAVKIPSEKPVVVSDSAIAFIHVENSGCSVVPSLNGKDGMGLMGMGGDVVLDNAVKGENKLSLRYSGPGEMKITIVTPEWVKSFERKASEEEKTEEFTFLVGE